MIMNEYGWIMTINEYGLLMIMNEYGSRDNRYDPYINSHECLVNPNSGFLTKYSHILRYYC